MQALPFLSVSILFIAKIFVVFAFFLYLIFALVVVRQVSLMIKTIEIGFEIPVKILSYVHLAFAVLVLLLALVIL